MKLPLTRAQQKALNALASRNGTGVFDKHNVLLCAGERLGFTKHTWRRLHSRGLVSIEGLRITITPEGRREATSRVARDGDVAINDRDWNGT